MNKKIIFSISALLLAGAVPAQKIMTLQEYENKVLDYSQQLKQARESLDAATAKRKMDKTGFLPKIDLGANGSLDLTNLDLWNAPVNFGSYHPYTYWGGAVLTQPIYTGGAIYNQYKADQLQEEVANEQVLYTIDNIYLQADQVYWLASASSDLFRISKEYMSIINTQYQIIKERFDNGAIAKNDLLMITTRLKEAELNLKKSESSYLIAYQNMNILMGVSPSAPKDSVEVITTPIKSPEEVSFEEALQKRPDYRSAELNVSIAKANRKASIAKFNPNLNFQTTGGWGTANPNYGFSPRWNVISAVNFSMPLFHWGERTQLNRQLKAQINSSVYNQQIMADQVSKEISNAWTNMDQSYEQIKVAEQTLTLAQEALDLNTYSYNEGTITISEVLSAQLSWIQAYTNYIQSEYNYKVAVASYKKVVGMIAPQDNTTEN